MGREGSMGYIQFDPMSRGLLKIWLKIDSRRIGRSFWKPLNFCDLGHQDLPGEDRYLVEALSVKKPVLEVA